MTTKLNANGRAASSNAEPDTPLLWGIPYDIPNTQHDLVIHDGGLRVGHWRSVSHALNAFANESFVDEMAMA